PVLTSVSTSAGVTLITGTLTSPRSTTVHLEFFANTPGDPEGRTLLGTWTGSTDASGNFTAVLLAPVPADEGLATATATDAAGNTSEFSAGVTAGSLSGPLVALVPDSAYPGQTALLVLGTSGNDTIVFTPGGNTGDVSV